MVPLPRPGVGIPAPWSFPTPKRDRLANGIDVLTYRLPGQHVVSVGLTLDLPLHLEPRDIEGVAALTVRCLDEGTLGHPGSLFEEAVENCGAVLAGSVGLSSTQVYVDVPARRLADAVNLLGEAIIAPELADADAERHRAIRAAEVAQQLALGSERAGHAFRHAVISPESRASRMSEGEVDTVERITGSDVRTFHASHYGPHGATLVIAGDFREDASALAEAVFGAWSPPKRDPIHERAMPRTPRAYLVDRPGSVQADIRWGAFTIDRQHPQWADLQVAAHVLGGGFLSRLNRVLREEKGFTYGVHLGNTPMRNGGLTTVSGSFRTEAVGESLELIQSLVNVADAPLTDAEVDDARRYLLGVAPLHFATASGVCNGVMALRAAGLDSTYVDESRDAYHRVTAASATEAALRALDPQNMVLVVVGDASNLADEVRAAGFEVEVTEQVD